MKTILYLAATLMIISGVLHVFPMFREVRDPNAIPMLGIAAVCLVVGALLFKNLKYAPILGIILTLMGLGIGFGVLGFNNWDALATILFSIDAIVLICCLVLLTQRSKIKTEVKTESI